MRRCHTGLLAGSLLTLASMACASHEDEPVEPTVRRESPVAIEAEPVAPLPAEVAPPLPELAPTRPLEHLGVLWVDDGATPRGRLWPVGRSPVAIADADAKVLGLTGPTVDPTAMGLAAANPEGFAGPLLLMYLDDRVTAVDPASGGTRWTTRAIEGSRLYWTALGRRVLVAQHYGPGYDRLIAWTLESGVPLWERLGVDDGDFDRIRQLWTDGERGYLRAEDAFVAFSLDDGSTLWTVSPASLSCGMVTADGLAIVEDPDGPKILDAATGQLRARVELDRPTPCTWEAYRLGGGAAAIAEGRLLAFVGDQLEAYSLDDGARLWSTPSGDASMVWADHDAVYVDRDRQELVALDAKTGRVRTTLMIGVPFSMRIEPVGGAAGPYLVGMDDLGGRWILGRRDAPVASEAYEIRGSVAPTDGLTMNDVRGLSVSVGGQLVKTDRRGRFVAKGEGRGFVVVERPDPYSDYDAQAWSTIMVESARVRLDGSGRYDVGAREAWEVSLE